MIGTVCMSIEWNELMIGQERDGTQVARACRPQVCSYRDQVCVAIVLRIAVGMPTNLNVASIPKPS